MTAFEVLMTTIDSVGDTLLAVVLAPINGENFATEILSPEQAKQQMDYKLYDRYSFFAVEGTRLFVAWGKHNVYFFIREDNAWPSRTYLCFAPRNPSPVFKFDFLT